MHPVLPCSSQRGVDLLPVDVLKAYVFSAVTLEKEASWQLPICWLQCLIAFLCVILHIWLSLLTCVHHNAVQAVYGEKWEEHEKKLGRKTGLSDVAKQLAIIFRGR